MFTHDVQRWFTWNTEVTGTGFLPGLSGVRDQLNTPVVDRKDKRKKRHVNQSLVKVFRAISGVPTIVHRGRKKRRLLPAHICGLVPVCHLCCGLGGQCSGKLGQRVLRQAKLLLQIQITDWVKCSKKRKNKCRIKQTMLTGRVEYRCPITHLAERSLHCGQQAGSGFRLMNC